METKKIVGFKISHFIDFNQEIDSEQAERYMDNFLNRYVEFVEGYDWEARGTIATAILVEDEDHE